MRQLRAFTFLWLLVGFLCVPLTFVKGQTAIDAASFSTTTTGLTTSSYTATSPSDAGGTLSASTSYLVRYGEVQNQFITDYTLGTGMSAVVYDNFVLPDTLIIQRTDAGRQLIIFYEFDNVNTTPNPDEITLDPERQNPEEGLYLSGLSNAGYDNILVNSATNFANVERIDIIYYSGVVTSSPSTAVFPIIDRGGNDDIRVAAIRGLDASGNPNDYYPTVIRVSNDGTSDWGSLGQTHNSLVLRRQDATSDPLPVVTLGTQTLHGTAIAFDEFGVTSNDIVYGYSIFADDVTVTGSDLVDFSNSTNFPTNTGSGSGLDLVAGISTAVSSDNNLTRSKGPGGYKEALDTWLKANVGVTTATDGSSVTDWQDQWLADNDATTLGTAPTYRDGSALATDDINFNPTVDFVDGVTRGLQIANNPEFNTDNNGLTTYSTKSINLAFRTGTDITDRQVIFEQGSQTRGLNVFLSGGLLYVGAYNTPSEGTGSNWGFSSASTSGGDIATETEYIVTLEFDGNTGLTGTVTAYLNGRSFGTISSVGVLFDDTDGIGLGNQNSQSLYDGGATTADPFDGSIAELIYCDNPGTFSATQRNRIETYLAVKYGITLDQSSPINYTDSEGTIIFNTTNAASIGGYLEYNMDIAGIGRDDDSEFIQTSSQSENNGSIVRVDKVGAAISDDNAWFLWGNDGGSTTPNRTESKPESINERLPRVWRVAEEKSIGSTNISFDLTGLGLGTNASDFSLLVSSNDSNADFSSAIIVSGGTFNGNVITFSGLDLSDGQYFTLGTQFFICTPGNVQDGLALWLKADAETFNTGTTAATNGQTVETWGDQSRSDFDATNDGGVTNRAPTWVETDVNFNPGLNWNAGTNEIGFTLGSNFIFSPAADGGAHVFASVDPESTFSGSSRTNKFVYNFGNNNNSAIGIGAYGDRGRLVAEGGNNINYTPDASSFLVEGEFNTNAGASDTKAFMLNGQELFTSTGTDIDLDDSGITQASTHGSNQGPVSIGRQSETNNLGNNGGRRFFGDMQEVIVYNAAITDLQEQQIRSYLALKYGSTLTNDNNNNATINDQIGTGSVQEGDYVASDGTTITWDYSDDTGFVSDVAGIGRDDDTCLNQKQSRSVNSDDIVTIGLGTIAANNAANANTFAADMSFLTWANDNASTAFANITTAGTPGTVSERMLRVWRAQETGTVGATDISFDLSALPGYSTNAGDYQLIIASGGDNTSLGNGSTVTGGTFDGTTLTFSGVNLTDGQYFTLGVSSELCAPGGVTGSMVLWLRADTGTSTDVDNTTLSTWTDQSTAGNDATSDGNPPLYKDNSTDNINFLPTLDFDGADDRLSLGDLNEIKSTTGTGRYTMFGVGIRQNTTTNYVLGSTGGTTNQDLHFGYRNSTTASIAHWGNDLDVGVNAYDGLAESAFLMSAEYDGSGRIVEEMNDDDFNRNTDSNTTDISGTQTNYVGFLGTTDGNYSGFISETLVYNAAITDFQKLSIYSYFGIKYGITLPQDNNNNGSLNEAINTAAEGDYVDSEGNIIWDESNSNSTYHNGMAGIGRDDNSCLNQKQSTSATDGTILTMGLGAVAADNAANANAHDNLDFLIWGHDNGATAAASVETSDVPSTISQRMTRVWRVEDTGTVGATEIQFDLTGLGYTLGDGSDYSLLISGSATMASASITTGASVNGNVISFTGIDLTDGQYFTLGTGVTTCGPGGVNTNIALWLRADLEVFSDAGVTAATDGGNALQWNDQSSPASNASEANAGGGAVTEPVYRASEINFNPANFISDQNTTNNSFFETAGSSNNVAGDMSLIAVFETAQNQGTDNDIENTPALIGAEVSSVTNDYALGVRQGQIVFNAANTNGYTAESVATNYNNGEPYIATATRVQAGSGAVNLYVNSLLAGTGTSDATLLNAAGTWAIGNHSDYDNEAQFQGNIAEVIVFSSALTADERTRLETYLAVKYGITRDDTDGDDAGTTTFDERDYRSGNGTVVWDYDTQTSTYYNDIFGIGRDDLSCLNQLRSKSENDDAIVDVQISSFTDDNSWFVSGNDNAAIEATRNTERPASINSRLNREWLAQETGTVGTVSVTFDLSDITGTPTDNNNLNLVRLMVDTDGDFSSGVTLISPTNIDAANRTVTFDYDFNMTDGFYYTLGSTENDALPVTLIEFTATPNDKAEVELLWTTASEANNSFFAIERSTDAVVFEVVGQVDGAGNSDGVVNYRFTDTQPLEGTSFYRLRQVDFNGEFEYSELRSVFVQRPEAELNIKAYPNPVNSGDLLVVERTAGSYAGKVSLQIFSLNGTSKITGNYEQFPEQILVDTKELKPGVYLLKLSSERGITVSKRVIIR